MVPYFFLLLFRILSATGPPVKGGALWHIILCFHCFGIIISLGFITAEIMKHFLLFLVHHTGLSLRERYSRHGQILIIYEFLSVPLYLHLYRTL